MNKRKRNPEKIFKANDTTYLIKFVKKALELNSKLYQSLCDNVKEVLGIIVSLLMNRTCVKDKSDRKRS
ncbi:7910_t:CDS:2 [Funneliformis caledonium]|uniref:7910_t:CDS:1 n=1 Tax=Funneliformis caledonium TaxID=1117310 RepID=A0A9N9E543_9GLOM|nr:7910_t:CDS:2 [Funneliformis caledonium]